MARSVTNPTQRTLLHVLQTKRARDHITAYLLLAPAALLIFVFEFFPVAFAFFVSLHDWRRFPDEFIGLDSYQDALGGFAYVVFFWLALGIIAYAASSTFAFLRDTRTDRLGRLFLIPGAAVAGAFLGLMNWVFVLLPIIMDAVRRVRGQQTTNNTFVGEFFNSFTFPAVIEAGNMLVGLGLVAFTLVALFLRVLRLADGGKYLPRASTLFLIAAAGLLLLRLTIEEANAAIDAARASQETLPVWTHVLLIGAGAGLVGSAFWMWQRATRAVSNAMFAWRVLMVTTLLIGGVLLVMELPQALSQADDEVLRGFGVATVYALFSVPLQLALGLLLAVLLFQKLRLRSFFRVVFFLPYITPLIATSIVFALLFSPDPNSPANQLLRSLGIDTQNWLLESMGVFQLVLGDAVPDALAGPALALVVIIVFGVWTFVGYSTVIFLAGLGNIDTEIYEAARIDGANGWQQFRAITLPLLSPTTFFLILITTIGTLQAFTQFFLLRRPGAYDSVDTINLYIFNEVRTDSPDFGYGSAMAFVLFAVILILTVVQNRVVGRKVFNG